MRSIRRSRGRSGAASCPICAAELADVFAIVARYGNDDDADAQRAYLLGMHEVLPDAIAGLRAAATIGSLALDRALPKLDLLAPAGKELVVRGLTRAIGADGVVTVSRGRTAAHDLRGAALSAAADARSGGVAAAFAFVVISASRGDASSLLSLETRAFRSFVCSVSVNELPM